MKRQDLLTLNWTGPQLTLDGRDIILSSGAYELLRLWGNCIVDCPLGNNYALGEASLVCYSTKDELKELRNISPEQRREIVVDFMIDHDGTIQECYEGLVLRLKSINAAAVESELPGKSQDAPPAF